MKTSTALTILAEEANRAFRVSPNQGRWIDSYKIRLAILKKSMRLHAAAAALGVSALRLAQAAANTSVSLEAMVDGAADSATHGVRSSHAAQGVFDEMHRDEEA